MNDAAASAWQGEEDAFLPETTENSPNFACSSCGSPLVEAFYEVNGTPFCESCSILAYDHFLAADSVWRLARAAVFGLVTAIAGSVVYFLVTRMTGTQFGLIAVLVGLLVGRAVKSGCGGRGGLVYQFLAVFLTYSAIVSASIPGIVDRFRPNPPAGRAAQAPWQPRLGRARPPGNFAGRPRPQLIRLVLFAIVIVVFAYVLPLLLAPQNPLMLVVIGFGLWEAWKINRKMVVKMEGPFYLESEEDPQNQIAPGLM